MSAKEFLDLSYSKLLFHAIGNCIVLTTYSNIICRPMRLLIKRSMEKSRETVVSSRFSHRSGPRTRSADCRDDKARPSKVLKPDNTSTGDSIKHFTLLACGSFNPITNMHLRMFEVGKNYLRSRFPECNVKGIISPVSDTYGKKGLAESKHRLKMCSLAIKSNNWIEISNWESKQESWTPTMKVLEQIGKMVGQDAGHTELLLLCGSDLMESFNTPGLWKSSDIEKIVSTFGLLVLQRYGFSSQDIVDSHEIMSKHKCKIHTVADEVVNNTSSTTVRRLLRNDQSVKYLIPDCVVQYIMKNDLYASEESENRNANIELKPFQVNRDT